MGLKASVADRGMLGLPGVAPVQGELLPPAAVASSGDQDDAAPERRGPGRPPGSPNKATVEVKAYLERRYRSPLIGLAEIGAGASLEELVTRARWMAKELGCKPLEAMKIVLDAADRLAPYMHSRMPQLSDAKPASSVTIVQVTAEQVGAAGGDVRLAVMVATGEQYQALSGDDARQLDAQQSDAS